MIVKKTLRIKKEYPHPPKAFAKEAPFAREEALLNLAFTSAWSPVKARLKQLLAEVIDFKSKTYKGGLFSASHIKEDELLHAKAHESWGKQTKRIKSALKDAYKKPFQKIPLPQVQTVAKMDEGLLEEFIELFFPNTIEFQYFEGIALLADKVEETVNWLFSHPHADEEELMYKIENLWRQLGKDDDFIAQAVVTASRAYTFGFIDATLENHHAAQAYGLDRGVSNFSAYKIVTVGDNRVCPVCRCLEGVVFDIERASEARQSFLHAGGNKDAAKEYFTWPKLSDVEHRSKAELSRTKFLFPPYHPFCFPEGTDVLTKEGWKDFSTVTLDDLFLSRHPDGMLEYIPAVKLIAYEYDGELIQLHGANFYLSATPDHMQPYYCEGKYFEEPLKTLIKLDTYEIPIADGKYAHSKDLTFARIPYVGMVRCVELERIHTLCVRQNGKVTFSGNCRCHTDWVSDLEMSNIQKIDICRDGKKQPRDTGGKFDLCAAGSRRRGYGENQKKPEGKNSANSGTQEQSGSDTFQTANELVGQPLKGKAVQFKHPEVQKMYDDKYNEYKAFLDTVGTDIDSMYDNTKKFKTKTTEESLTKFAGHMNPALAAHFEKEVLGAIRGGPGDSIKNYADINKAYLGVMEWQGSAQSERAVALKMKAAILEMDRGGGFTTYEDKWNNPMYEMSLINTVNAMPNEDYIKLRAYGQAYMDRFVPGDSFKLHRGVYKEFGDSIQAEVSQAKIEGKTHVKIDDMNLVGYTPKFDKADETFGASSGVFGGTTITTTVNRKDVFLPEQLVGGYQQSFESEREWIVFAGTALHPINDIKFNDD